MTLDDFLIELNAVAKNTEWRMLGSAIRTVEGYCPICFLAKEKGLNHEDYRLTHLIIAERIGISALDSSKITWCADLDTDKYGIRKHLIKITGVAS